MKIAVLDPWCFTPPYNDELCCGLASIGHDVTLIGQVGVEGEGRRTGGTAGYATLGLFKEPARSMPGPVRLLAKGLRHIEGQIRCLSALRRMRPDVIHAQWLPLPLIDALFVPLLRRIAPVVLTVHDSNPYNGTGPLLLRMGNLLALKRCDRWIVHNDVSERQLVEHGLPQARLHRIAHGLLGEPIDRPDVRARQDDGRVHLLQFGKIKDYKGVDVLLNALGRLNGAQRERCRVSIVGRPYLDTAPLLELVARHRLDPFVDLRFDFVSDAEMAALFDQADALVFPYRGIDTSGVLMAAIARGIPVVASAIGCFSEMLVNGREGRLVTPGDPEALAAALVDLIDNPAKVQAMRVEMVALRQRIPSWQQIAEKTIKVYQLAQASQAPATIGAPV
ncbi:MAG: glycosyltransferase family 4 protein [Alphaproteobacteria bacterium]